MSEIVTVNGHIVSDDITLDIPSILNQVCDNHGIDPDETTGLQTARRGQTGAQDIWASDAGDAVQTLEIPLNTAYSRLRLARDQLARAVTDLRIARGVR